MKKLVLLLLVTMNVAVMVCYAQNNPHFEYNYDAAGNRIQRKYSILRISITDSTNNFDNAVINIYPNPTNGQLTLQVQSMETLQQTKAEVFDNAGRLVLSVTPLTETNNISIINEKNGLYILRVTINGKMQQFNVVKIE